MVAALYALAPPVWINVAWWGQADALLMLPMLLTVILFERAKGRLSWLFWVLALLIKPQAIILAPLMYIVTLRHYGCKGLVEGGALAAGVAGLAIVPLALAGQVGNLLSAYLGSVGRFPRATAGAYNVWYLWLGPIARDTDRVVGSISARNVGFLLLGGAVALVCGALLFRNDGPGRARAAALLALAFFCLPTQIHERYMFLSLAFLTLCIVPDQRWIWLWLWVVSAATLNILAELSGFVPLIDATLGRSPLRYVIAAGNIVALCGGLWALYAQKRMVSTQDV
jgi:Gpi18-like mannosyltransferase